MKEVRARDYANKSAKITARIPAKLHSFATFSEAAQQAGLSRLYGGIHPTVDDFTGRIVGSQVGIGAWDRASKYFDGTAVP